MLILSFEDFELTARTQLYPLFIDTIAKLKPVFPDVVSIIVAPGFKIPLRSASSIIYLAILSLFE